MPWVTLVAWQTSELHIWPADPTSEATVQMKQGHLGSVAWIEEADVMPRAESQPLKQLASLSPEAQPSAEHGTCGHMLPRALFLPMLTHGGGQAQKGMPSQPSCS